jgi:small-conductance mechanosensitive channel
VHWREGLNALAASFEAVRAEIAIGFGGGPERLGKASNLPLTFLLMIVGLVLMVRGRFWTRFLMRTVRPQAAISARWMISFLMSLGEIVIPYLGMLVLIKGFELSGVFATHSGTMLDILRVSFLIFLVSRWAALRCFPRGDEDRLPLDLAPEQRRAGRLYGGSLGVIIGAAHFFHQLGDNSGWSMEARVVVLFPILVLAGLLLSRLARLLSLHTRASGDGAHVEAGEGSYRNRLARFLSRVLIGVAIAAPTLAAIGYYKATLGLMMPSLLSLLLLAALLILQGVINEIYSLATRSREGASDELVPMLAGFVMVLMSLPLFALIWGARVADLSELWVSFKRGITLGDLTISPSIFLTLAIVFTVGFLVTRLVQGTLKNSLLPKTKMETGARDAIVSGVGYIGIFLAALIAVTSAGIDLSSLAIVAGALSVGIGFGLQNIVSNFVSGIILLIERPISQGDWIEVNGQHGTVREISVRSTRIETFDRSDLIIPNSDLVSGVVTNYTKGSTVGRVIVKVGVAYGTDTKWVESILREIATSHPMVLMNPEPTILFKGIGVDSFDFEIRAILRDVNWIMNVASDMNHEIAKRFAAEGIEMPYQQRDIWLRNPETLSGATGGAAQRKAAEKSADTDATQTQNTAKASYPAPKDKAQHTEEAQRMDDADGATGDGDGR